MSDSKTDQDTRQAGSDTGDVNAVGDDQGRVDQPETVIAWLHCEIPTGEKPAIVPPNHGTVELEEADGGGPTARETITLFNSHALRIGRARANDLVIENRAVSRFHAVISGSPTGVVLSDLSSLNGTFLNGRRISSPVDVATGDIISIGTVKITLELSRGVPEPLGGKSGSPNDDDYSISSTHAARMSSTLVTVLVVDVRGFTTLSQGLPASEVAEMLNRWFGIVGKTVIRERGEIDKYIGDCVMALWRGNSETISELTVRAVRAAERIVNDTKTLATSGVWKYEDQHPWRCRAALNTGEALVGAVGKGGARDYTVLGDTVNIAFRLESLASAEGTSLILSGATADCVSDLLPLRSLGEVILEGRKDNIEIFTIADS